MPLLIYKLCFNAPNRQNGLAMTTTIMAKVAAPEGRNGMLCGVCWPWYDNVGKKFRVYETNSAILPQLSKSELATTERPLKGGNALSSLHTIT